MNRLDLILDQPQTIDVDALDVDATWLLANHEIRFRATAQSDLVDLEWPWAGESYARAITLSLATLQGDALMALANRYYPAYQETILGDEGFIVSKRLVAPFRSADDRSALWQLECQAEGDLVLRLDVTIDWGEPLTQRMVDGLLVAQRAPGPQQGIYQQSRAASTRVFGNPQGPPTSVELDDEAGTATLGWWVLVNGIVDVALLLTLSDVGEQVAWNGFLAQREVEQTVAGSTRAWDEMRQRARLWTPDARLNRALDGAKRSALQHFVHLRPGYAPASRAVADAPALVDLLDMLDRTHSRNLLAHVRRVAERSNGMLPDLLPASASSALPAPQRSFLRANHAWLTALDRHLQRHFDADLLASHWQAVMLCTEALIRERHGLLAEPTVAEVCLLASALRISQALAARHQDMVNATRWQSEFEAQARLLPDAAPPARAAVHWQPPAAWREVDHAPTAWTDPVQAAAFASALIWDGLGIDLRNDAIGLNPATPTAWAWWALLDLPTAQGALALVWDGSTLHTNLPVTTTLPTQQYAAIRALHTDELDFDLTFAFFPHAADAADEGAVAFFRPLAAAPAPPSSGAR